MDMSHILTKEQRRAGLTVTMLNDDFIQLRMGVMVVGVFNESVADVESIRSLATSILSKPNGNWLRIRIGKLLRKSKVT